MGILNHFPPNPWIEYWIGYFWLAFEWIFWYNEYFKIYFELNIELDHFWAQFNVWLNNQNVSDRATVKPYQFWKLMTHAIHRPPAMTMTNTHTKTKIEKFQEKWVNEYRLKYSVLMIIGWHVLAHDTHCQPQDKDKYKDKDKTKENNKFFKRPNMCYIFEKLRVQGYQIWHSCIISASSVDHQCIISVSSVHHHCIISASSAHHQRITKPDQDREDFNLADLILELSFLFCTFPYCKLCQICNSLQANWLKVLVWSLTRVGLTTSIVKSDVWQSKARCCLRITDNKQTDADWREI